MTVTADDLTKYQGEEDPTPTATVEGLLNGDSVVYTLTVESDDEAGEYPIVPSGDATQGNYVVIYVPGTLTVLPVETPDPDPEPEPEQGRFTLFYVSDAMLSGSGTHDDAFAAMTLWMAQQWGRKGAIAVVDSGNLVASHDNEAAWNSARTSLAQLPKALPYFDVAGSTDVNGDALSYDAYLANDLCMAADAEEFEDGRFWYHAFAYEQILLVGVGRETLAETEEEKAHQEEWLAFIDGAIKSHAGYTVVLTVNDYLDENGEIGAFGALLEERIVAPNANVRVILCGGGAGTVRLEKTYGGRRVNAIRYNYQADEENGLGFLRMLTFDPEARTITVTTYSPVYDVTCYDKAHPELDNYVIRNAF